MNFKKKINYKIIKKICEYEKKWLEWLIWLLVTAWWAWLAINQIDWNDIDWNDIDKTKKSEKIKTVSAEEMKRWSILGEIKDWVVKVLRNDSELKDNKNIILNNYQSINFDNVDLEKRNLIKNSWIELWDIKNIYKKTFENDGLYFKKWTIYYIEFLNGNLWIMAPIKKNLLHSMTAAFMNWKAQSLWYFWWDYIKSVKNENDMFIVYSMD